MPPKTSSPQETSLLASGHQPRRTRYEGSSQHRRWTYTAEKLESNRAMLSERAIASCRKNHAKELELQFAANAEYTPKSALPEYPSHADELLLTRFYLTQLTSVLSSGSFGRPIPPLLVEDVAITYLKRFYLRTSCLEWHPKVIMPVCLFLAAKVCNIVLDVDAFVAVFDKLKKEDVLELEYLVVQTLRYDLLVPQPKDELRGWYYRLQDPACPATQTRLQTLLPIAELNLRKSRLSDAEHLYTPSQIAATCWRIADRTFFDSRLASVVPGRGERELGDKQGMHSDVGFAGRDAMEVDVDGNDQGHGHASAISRDESKHLTPSSSKPDDQPAEADKKFPWDALLNRLDEIEAMLRVLMPANLASFDLKRVKAVDKAVRACQDPIRVKTSAVYAQKQELTLAKEAEKRAGKIARARKEMSSQDTLFGPVIDAHNGQVAVTGSKGEAGFPAISETGMGIPAEGGGMVFGGEGLRDVGLVLSDSESD